MRGHDEQTNHMFRYLSPEQWGPADHPLRAVRALTDQAPRSLSRRFASLYAQTERPSIPPEQWLRAVVLQVLYTVRNERLVMEDPLQPPVPVVRRIEHGRSSLASHDVHPKIGIGCLSPGMAYFQRRSKHFGFGCGHLLIVAI